MVSRRLNIEPVVLHLYKKAICSYAAHTHEKKMCQPIKGTALAKSSSSSTNIRTSPLARSHEVLGLWTFLL